MEDNFDDSGGQGNDGNGQGGINFANGMLGRAGNFDGNNDRVRLPGSASLNITGDISVAAWVNPVSGSAAIIHKGAHYSIFRWSNGRITWADSSSWCYACFGSFGNVPNGSWSHVAATKQGSAVTLYVNGVSVVSKSFGNSLTTNSSTAHIGCYAGNSGGNNCTGYYFRGLIDEGAVWDRALTSSEVQELYNSGSGKIIQ
jgi:hypothetical protein